MPGQRALTVGILTSVFGVAFQGMAVTTAMPAAAADLGQLGLFAWAFSLFVIGMTLSTVVGGRLADHLGPILPAVIGMGVFIAGLVAAALSQTMLLLVVSRFVQGLGGGMINVALMVLVAKAYDEVHRATLMTAFSFCWMLPAFIGPPVAAWLTNTFSWHAVFWSVIPLLLVSVALCAWPLAELRDHLRPVHEHTETPVPVWAAVTIALGLAGLQAGGQRLGATGAVMALAGLAVLVASLPKLMASGFFTVAPGIAAVSWSRMLQAGTFFATEAFLPLALIQIRGLSLFQAGLTLTVGSTGWTLGSWLQSRAWFRLRRDQIIVLGAALCVAGIGLVAATTWWDWWLGVYALAWTVAGLGMGLGTASGSLAVMQLSETHRLGRNTSSLQVSEAMGNAGLVGLAGTIFAGLRTAHLTTTVFGTLFSVLALASVGAVLASRRIGPVRNVTANVG